MPLPPAPPGTGKRAKAAAKEAQAGAATLLPLLTPPLSCPNITTPRQGTGKDAKAAAKEAKADAKAEAERAKEEAHGVLSSVKHATVRGCMGVVGGRGSYVSVRAAGAWRARQLVGCLCG